MTVMLEEIFKPTDDDYGVYYLLNDDELIYIGQTRRLKTRLKQHRDGYYVYFWDGIYPPKIFNRVLFEEVRDKKDRLKLESKRIGEYAPLWNCKKFSLSEQRGWSPTVEDVIDDFEKVEW